MSQFSHRCSDCGPKPGVSRRDFLITSAAAGAAAAVGGALPKFALADEAAAGTPETTVAKLYGILTPEQKKTICFPWDHMDGKRGLLRTRVANNWHITEPVINGDFFTDDQRDLIREVYKGILNPEWHAKIDRQLEDDAGGYGNDQNIAIFGEPGSGKFEFVMTGRHMTLRCDGDSAEHMAFGGPIFYGHAPEDVEEIGHPGNVFWEQGVAANRVFDMLDGATARAGGTSNAFGTVFDHTVDRYAEYLILLGGPFGAAVLAKGIVTYKLDGGTLQNYDSSPVLAATRGITTCRVRSS